MGEIGRTTIYSKEFRKNAERELGFNYHDVQTAILEYRVFNDGQPPNLNWKRDRMRLGRLVRRRVRKCLPVAEWLDRFDQYILSVEQARLDRRSHKRSHYVLLSDRVAQYKANLVSSLFKSCHPMHRESFMEVVFSPEGEANVSVHTNKTWKRYGCRSYLVTNAVWCKIVLPVEWLEWRRRWPISYRGSLVLSVRHEGGDCYELLVTHQSRGYLVTTKLVRVRLTESGWVPFRGRKAATDFAQAKVENS